MDTSDILPWKDSLVGQPAVVEGPCISFSANKFNCGMGGRHRLGDWRVFGGVCGI
jgi:hypothetical protein